MIRVLRATDGHCEAIGPEAIDLSAAALYWVDMERSSDEEDRILSETFRFHHLAIEDCVHDIHHPKVDDYGDYLYLVLHGVRYRPEKEFDTIELDVFLGKRYLLTYHHEPMRSINETWDKALQGPPFLSRGADMLLHSILDTLVDHYFPVFELMEERADAIEEEVFGHPGRRTLERILALKRDVLHLKRIAGPQRDVFARLSRGGARTIADDHLMYFRDLYDHLFRMADIADSYRDMLQGMQDAYLSVISNRLNEVMKVLTMVSTIMAPFMVVGGIYGMNFQHMPELRLPYGYPMALAIMAAMAGGLFAWFKAKRWI